MLDSDNAGSSATLKVGEESYCNHCVYSIYGYPGIDMFCLDNNQIRHIIRLSPQQEIFLAFYTYLQAFQ